MTREPPAGPGPARPEAWRFAVVAGAAVAVCALLELHVQWLNGMLWTRRWCRRPALEFLPLFCAASVPIWLAVAYEIRGRARASLAVLGLTLGCFSLMLAASVMHDGGFSTERLPRVIQHEYATSYYTDALELRGKPELLARYPQRMDSLHLHSENKPPGPILFFMAFIALFGPGMLSAHVSGLCLALLAALIVPAVFLMVRALGGSRDAAFASAALTALCPGLVLGLPSMDQVTPLFTCGLVATWAVALRDDSPRAALAFGVLLAAALFFTPLILVVGFFLACMTVLHLAPRATRSARLPPVARAVAIALAALAGVYGALFVFTGYDVFAVFREILGSKHDWDPERTRQELLGRPYWKALISDPWEFALGTGWLIGLLALSRIGSALRERLGPWRLELLALVQIALMPQLGFVRGESARLWLFLVPFLALTAGAELARWPAKQRAAALACLALVCASIYRNMLFVGM